MALLDTIIIVWLRKMFLQLPGFEYDPTVRRLGVTFFPRSLRPNKRDFTNELVLFSDHRFNGLTSSNSVKLSSGLTPLSPV